MDEGSYLAVVLVGVLLCAAAPQAAAQSDAGGLTVDEAVDRALNHPLRRQIRRAEADAEKAAARAEKVWPNPTLGWAREQFWEGPLAISAEDDFTLEQSLPITGEKRFRWKSARARRRASAAQRRFSQMELEAEVRRAFYDVLVAEEKLEIWNEQVEVTEARVEQLRANAGKGQLARVDLLSFEQALAGTRIDRDEFRSGLESKRSRLATLVSGRAEASKSPGGVSGDVLPPEPPPLEELKRRAEERPDLQALEHRAEAASRARRAASRHWLPEPTVLGGYKRIDAEAGGSIHGFIAGLSIPLGVVDRGQWSAREAAARKRRIDSRLALTRTRVERRLESQRRAAVEALERAVRFREEVLSRAKTIYQTKKSARKSGAASLMEAQEAHAALLEARRRALDLAHRARVEQIELLATAGFDDEG